MLAVLTTHPIQYQIPVWRKLAQRGNVPVKVYYMSDQGLAARHDPGFGRAVAWDIDALSGYDHAFLPDVRTGAQQSSFWWLRLRQHFAEQAKREGARVLWIQGWQVAAYWQAVWQAERAGLETWLRADTNLRSTGHGPLAPLKRRVLQRLLKRIDSFLYVGEANREFYLARSVPPNKLIAAPHCVDNARFAAQASALRDQRSAIRRKWGIAAGAYCVVFAGKLIDKKRPLDLVAASRLAQEKLRDRPLHLLFVGTGELLRAVKEQCAVRYDFERGSGAISDAQMQSGLVSASFTGFLNQSEIAQAYVAADCLALPSDATETWGLVVNEAMATGLPAVVSDAIGSCDDLIKPFRPDLCFPPGDHTRFAEALVSCMINPPSQTELMALIDRYDVLRTVESVESLYQASLAGSGKVA